MVDLWRRCFTVNVQNDETQWEILLKLSNSLFQILENEDQFGQHESSECVAMSSSETCDALKSSISRIGLNGRRGSLQGPEIAKVFSQGRRHSTGQVLTYR